MMNRTLLKRIGYLLVAILLFSLLVACDTNDGGTGEIPDSESAESLESDKAQETDATTESCSNSDVGKETTEPPIDSKPTQRALFFDTDNPLSDYVIVYADENGREAGEYLAAEIYEICGCVLPVVSYTEPERACEILIGITPRDESMRAYDSIGAMELLVKADGKKLLVGGNTPYSLKNGVRCFVEKYGKDDTYSEPFTFSSAIEEITYLYSSKYSPARSEGTDVRVMSWNLLYDSKEYPIMPRAEYAAAVIRQYAPDVIGTQETSEGWYTELARIFDGEYAYVTSVDETGGENYSTLWYRTDTVKVVDSGVMNYSEAAVKKMRIVTWALFENLENGERFIVTSTHWDREIESPEGINITYQAGELAKLLEELREAYPVPTFCTGDYNRTPGTKQYKRFLELTSFEDAPNVAETIYNEYPTYHDVGSDELKVGLIDHIFCSPESRVLFYTSILDPAAIDASDHCPIYIDAAFADGETEGKEVS